MHVEEDFPSHDQKIGFDLVGVNSATREIIDLNYPRVLPQSTIHFIRYSKPPLRIASTSSPSTHICVSSETNTFEVTYFGPPARVVVDIKEILLNIVEIFDGQTSSIHKYNGNRNRDGMLLVDWGSVSTIFTMDLMC
jgi:hypothetical protein